MSNRLRLIIDDADIKVQPAILLSGRGWIVKCHWRECLYDTYYQETEDSAYDTIQDHIKEKHMK